MKMAVVGKDVSKSLSPKMHKFILGQLGVPCTYDTISIPEGEFDEKIGDVLKEYDTLNVTIPYKLNIMEKLNAILGDAKTFGAVNTVKVKESEGYNTDGEGFMLSLITNGVVVNKKDVLVIGTGGVGRSVIKKLADAGANVFAAERDEAKLKEVFDEFGCFTPIQKIEPRHYDLALNCTGVGMHKSEGKSPVGEDILSLVDVAFDLIYEPKKSEFLRIAESLGKQIINGEGMLFYQAYYADCIFLGKEANAEEAKKLFLAYTEAV